MAVATGARTTSTVASGQIKVDIADDILNLDPEESPFTVILKKSMREKVVSSTFKWAEDARELRWDAVNNGAGYSDSATSVVVDTGTRFYAGALVIVPRTGEIVRVTTVSTNTLTIVRGAGGSAAVALVDNDPLLVLGYAADENSRAPSVRTENPSFVTNYTQIFKKTVGSSGSWRSSDNETSPIDWKHQKKKAHVEHMIDIEQAGLFGKPATTAGTDGPLRTTGGALHFLTKNAQAVGGTLSEAVFDTFLAEKAFAEGSREKVLYASSFLISVIANFAKSKLNTVVAESKYGVNFTDYVTPQGKISIIDHKLLEGAIYGKMGFVVDYKKGGMKYRYLDGGEGGSRDTHVLVNRQETDRDGQIDEIITEAGFQVGLPATGATITGVTG